MNAYKQKIAAELELAQAKLTAFKNQPESLTMADRISRYKHIEELEQRVVATRAELRQLDGADENDWHQMKDSLEGTWKSLQNEIEEAITGA